MRGAAVTQGYYKNDQKTKEDFKEGGWFATGDIGYGFRASTAAALRALFR